MSIGPPQMKEFLIVSVTPQNLERGALRFDKTHHKQSHDKHLSVNNAETKKLVPREVEGWFKENFSSIKKAHLTNPWWRDNSVIIEKDLALKPSAFIRRLVDLGYEKTQSVLGKGLFAVRGGIIELWPINTEKPYLVEFAGNVIKDIFERPESAEKIKLKIPSQKIEKLLPGSYVVHVDHGIGIFRGITAENLESRIQNQEETERNSKFQILNSKLFIIEYAPPSPGRAPDLLYVPVDQKNRLSPYIGFETPRIHRLGGTIWQNTKRRVREDAEKLARELLELYAKRHATERPPHSGDPSLEATLRESFIFQETPDQLRAEEEILRDLSLSQPMDRILCGDVGFGKTELAIRAALRVIASGRQAAVLTPTTVLAAQHEKTFKDRLESHLPVTVAALSRLTASKDERQTLKALAEGQVDCIIGTHRLLSRDIRFKTLGLVIIDEEQRFGVKQKERFKEMRSDIDILSLSATLIPRTLSLALAKLRAISLIETPPPERLPIITSVLPHSQKTIRTALDFEISRGGQIYFLHNRIETLGSVKEKLQKILPAKSIGVLHGRMPEKEIIRVMEEFRGGEIKILLATTLIENGLDISTANTLVVDDATRLGLAQAHQLRGRIGRG